MEAVTGHRTPPFRHYRNQSGHSGVLAYALMPEAIAVQFADGSVNLYNHDCPGRRHVARMKVLAREGRGLSTYISRHIRNRFAARIAAGRGNLLQPDTETVPAQSRTWQNAALR